jgi:hypothetical protein
MALSGGFLLHAAGVRAGKQGLLFVGTDGIGKSTMARLWTEVGIGVPIGDDQIAVRERNGRFWMHSTPWHGIPCTIGELPIDQIFVLRQGPRNTIKQLSPVQAVAQLYKRSFPPYWLPDGLRAVVAQLGEFCTRLPVYELEFVPEHSVVDMLQGFLGE